MLESCQRPTQILGAMNWPSSNVSSEVLLHDISDIRGRFEDGKANVGGLFYGVVIKLRHILGSGAQAGP